VPSAEERLTTLLSRWRDGDQLAGQEVVQTVYDELRRIAGNLLRKERLDHTLQPTALVHEMYLRFFESQPVDWQNRAHFFAVAAQQLRRILVNHARDRVAAKRGGGALRLTLTSLDSLAGPREQDVLELNEALERLETFDSRAARVIELRFFGGMTEPEMAESLGISIATVKRDWVFARAFLISQLNPDG